MTYKECLELKIVAEKFERFIEEEAAVQLKHKGDVSYCVTGVNLVIYKFENGDKYVGKMIGNKFNGYGIYYFSNGEMRVGTWKDNELNGNAILFYSNGTCQKEEWAGDTNCCIVSDKISIKKLQKELKEQKELEK